MQAQPADPKLQSRPPQSLQYLSLRNYRSKVNLPILLLWLSLFWLSSPKLLIEA